MAYEQYRGRNIGRLLHFLYDYIPFADNLIFDGHEVKYGGQLFCNYEWDEESDVPTFRFVDKWAVYNDIQECRKSRLLEDEKILGRKPWTSFEESFDFELGWHERPRESGKWDYRIRVGAAKFYEVVAHVSPRPDGRFNWRRIISGWNPNGEWNEHKQGVAKTLEEAKQLAVTKSSADVCTINT